ncbi:MAG: hypothetical protein MZW92_39370 [Comamonadaceae bacterium]|nr:hypothetical protein [Comamonadaceae bacterium]
MVIERIRAHDRGRSRSTGMAVDLAGLRADFLRPGRPHRRWPGARASPRPSCRSCC